jgi:CcmD family protein
MEKAKAAFMGLPALPAMGVAQQSGGGSSNLGYLFAVFFITWLVFFAYAVYMTRKQQGLRNELEQLRRQMAEREQGGRKPS